MFEVPLVYAVIRYCPDDFLGERVNVGVIAMDLETGRASVQIDPRVTRIRRTFGVGVKWAHTMFRRRVERAVNRWNELRETLLKEIVSAPVVFQDLLDRAFPNADAAYQPQDQRSFVGESMEREVKELYSQFVGVVAPAKVRRQRLDDAEMLTILEQALTKRGILYETDEVFLADGVIPYDALIRQHRVALQAVSFDFLEESRILGRMCEEIGKAVQAQASEFRLVIYANPPHDPERTVLYKSALRLAARTPTLQVFEVGEEDRLAAAVETDVPKSLFSAPVLHASS